jgi:hypothetical protein
VSLRVFPEISSDGLEGDDLPQCGWASSSQGTSENKCRWTGGLPRAGTEFSSAVLDIWSPGLPAWTTRVHRSPGPQAFRPVLRVPPSVLLFWDLQIWTEPCYWHPRVSGFRWPATGLLLESVLLRKLLSYFSVSGEPQHRFGIEANIILLTVFLTTQWRDLWNCSLAKGFTMQGYKR